MADILTLEKTAHRVVADPENPRTVRVTHGDRVYYGPDPDVSADSHKGVIRPGKAKSFKSPTWIISASERFTGYPPPADPTTEDSIRLREALADGEDLRELDTRRVERDPIRPAGFSVLVTP